MGTERILSQLSFPELIQKKRDGQELCKLEIQQFVSGATDDTMQDSQVGAMLMAIYLKGMSAQETSDLTHGMMTSGDTLSWPEEWRGLVVDKHSTGGVGDKISLPLAPALAACGLKVPMISGRGLDFTGGTLDKLESIPGYTVEQNRDSMLRLLSEVGCCIVGQSGRLVPADKRLYTIRDITGTVSSIPLIVGSIISKKGAEGLDALVLDVKTGRAAVMTPEEDAIELARQMVDAGASIGMRVTGLLTEMNRPLGKMVGNALEIAETLQCLHGGGPASIRELVTIQGGHLLYNAAKAGSEKEGAQMIADVLDNGEAVRKFCQMLKGQGVTKSDADRLCDKEADVFTVLRPAKYKTDLLAPKHGYVEDIDAMACARVCVDLRAGRTSGGQSIDHAVGLQLHVEKPDHIQKGAPWMTVHHNTELTQACREKLENSLTIADVKPKCNPLVMKILRAETNNNNISFNGLK